MHPSSKPIVNPRIVVRREFEDSGMLFNPDTGETYGLNATGLLVMEHLDGNHTVADIVEKIKDLFDGVSDNAALHIQAFIDMMIVRDYVICDDSKHHES